MKDDPETMRSGAYFKDPGNKQDLTGKEPREVICCLSDTGKFIWPQIKFSDGSVGKIVYSLWTEDEKAIYKQYRAGGTKREKKEKSAIKQTEEGTHPQVEDTSVHRHIGVWFMNGVIHDLFSAKDSKFCKVVIRRNNFIGD